MAVHGQAGQATRNQQEEHMTVMTDQQRFRRLNACRCCGHVVRTCDEMAAILSISRRTWFRWLDGSAGPNVNRRVHDWIEANPVPNNLSQ
jgi:hypothetical protein